MFCHFQAMSSSPADASTAGSIKTQMISEGREWWWWASVALEEI
jgi:hypothetical protein